MKNSGSKTFQSVQLVLEWIVIAIMAGALWFPEWKELLFPFAVIGIGIYGIFTIILSILLVIGNIVMWIAIYKSSTNDPNFDQMVEALSKKRSIWEKIASTFKAIIIYAIKIAVAVFFAYAGHPFLSGVNVFILFNCLFMVFMIHKLNASIKESQKKDTECQ